MGFMGLKNTISTYNWQGANLLQYQDYTACVRREEGMCGLQLTESSSSIADSFELPAGQASYLCANGFISIPNGVTFKNGGAAAAGDNMYRNCNGALAAWKNGVPAAAYTKSFSVNVYTAGGASTAHTGSGMSLDYAQLPCGFTQIE